MSSAIPVHRTSTSAELRARAAELLDKVRDTKTRAVALSGVAREMIATSMQGLTAKLRDGSLAEDFAQALERAAKEPPSTATVPARAVFVLLTAQVQRSSAWLVGASTDAALEVAGLEGEVRGLIAAAEAIEACEGPSAPGESSPASVGETPGSRSEASSDAPSEAA